MKVVLLKISLMNFILGISKEIKWKVKSVTPNIIDEINSLDVQGDQMEDERGVSRSTIDELHSSNIHGDQMEGEKCYSKYH